MRIAFNPSTVAALIAPPNNKDITFDLRGQNIFARGVKFCGTDTNTWRDIKINNVSIGSNTLDLRDGSNTTLTNTNGVVTINSTWRPVVDNLTSDSTTSSLSANQGRILKVLIDGKSDSGHTHDGRYLRLNGSDTMLGNLNLCSIGSSYIGKGSGDKSGADFTEANIVIRSWWGISFKSYDDIVRTYIDTRTGNIGTKGVLNAVGAVIQGRIYNGGDDEGILIKKASNGWAGLILGSTDSDRSCFYLGSNSASWKYVKDGIDTWIQHPYKNGTIALTSDIPTSLKNPYALTISLNGTSQGPYDGSAAKNINITPGSIGAATSDHNHINYLSANGLISGNIDNIWTHGTYGFGNRSSYTGTLPGNSSYGGFLVLNPNATTTGTYYTTQIALLPGYFGYRIYDDGKWYDWKEVSMVGHNHDGHYVRYYAVTTLDCNNLAVGLTAAGVSATNAAHTNHSAFLYISDVGTPFQIQIPDSSVPYIYKRYYSSGTWSGWFKLNAGYADSAGSASNLTVHQYLSDTDTTWWPLIWGGSSHSNTSDSTGTVYKSYDKLSWQTSSQTLYATKLQSESLTTGSALFVPGTIKDATLKIYSGRTTDAVDDGHIGLQTSIDSTDGETHTYPTQFGSRCVLALQPRGGSVYIGNMPNGGNGHKLNVNGDIGLFNVGSIRDLTIGGGIYWNPYVESATDGSDAASITVVKSGVAGGTTLVLSQMNDANDTIQFQTNGSARLYHNSYPILTTQNTYVSNNKGYINGTEITQVNNADTLDGYHETAFPRLVGIKGDTWNWNDVIRAGYYKIQSGTITNHPSGIYPFGMAEVITTENHNDGENRELQIYYPHAQTNNIAIWLRMHNSGTQGNGWGSWVGVPSTYGNIASATKLQTPRTIWGQSFDGTADVNGLLTHIISSDDQFLNVHDNRTSSGYQAIRYFRNGADVAALHWFHDKFGGCDWNSNCLNLDPYRGGYVTLGCWDNPDLTVIRGGNIGIGTTNPSSKLTVNGVGNDQSPVQLVNASRNGTWVYTASFLAPNLTSNHNNAIFIGKAHNACNAFGLTHMHIGDGSVNNYAALEVWGVGNVQRWYYDRHSAFLHRADFSSLGSDASYMNSALQIREHGYNGAQADTWANAPRMSWHWGGRVQTQIGLASNNELYLSKNDFGNAYKLVYETGTWGINISGNATTSTKSEYSRSLLGRSTSGNDYDTNSANLVFAEWNTMSDNRWYLKATGYECRVAYANNAGDASRVYGYVGDTGSHELVRCDMNNDQFRIIAGSNGNNNGWAEIATADDGNEPIYVRQYSGVFSSVVRTLTLLDANGYTHFPSYINIGGNENNNSSPDRVWGSNSSDSYLRSYRTSALNVNYAASAGRANYLSGHGVNPDNSHPGHGARVFYSWNTGCVGNSSSGYSNGITIGSHPNDTAYGFQIVQNMWDDRTYTRRYNGGWQSWKTLAWTSDIPTSLPANGGNADTVDGYHASSSNKPWGTIPVITTQGFMDIGKNLEFHYDNTTGSDYSTALMCQGNYSNIVYLPSASGTLALTSDIPNPTNYYWANVKISTSSSTTTSPTVSNLTATSSIKMSNILLEHTDEINNSANGGIHLNYRNSGNVSLCQGGGNVGIGTTSPSHELDVMGDTFTTGFGIRPYYLSNSESLPTISPGDGYTYRCLEIGKSAVVSCIIADRVVLSNERGVLIKFNTGFDGQIVLLKDLEQYGNGNGYFWVMPSGCTMIRPDGSSTEISYNQISNAYDDGKSRFFVYSSKYNRWIEFYCG